MFMKRNKIFSGKISPCKTFKKDSCIVWTFLGNRKPCWAKVLFSDNGFHYGGIDITHNVIAWKPLSKKELQSGIGHKELTKKEKIFISSLDDKNKE